LIIKIATIYTLYNQRGGAELFTEKLVKMLSSFNNKVNIVVFCNKRARDVLSSQKNVEFIYIKWLNNQVFKTLWLEYFAWVYMFIYNIDIFWNPSGANHFPGYFFPKTISTILDIGEYFVKNKYGYLRQFYRKNICLPRTLKRSSKIVTISRETANAVKDIFNYKEEIKVIYLAADPWNNNQILSKISLVKSSLNFDEEEYLLCVGRIDYVNKGIDIILDSYIDLQNLYDMPKLVFVGSLGVDGKKLIKVIDENNLTEKVQYLGRVGNYDLEKLYLKAKVNILASRYEGFGITLIESFIRGIPILCSNIRVLKEIGGDAPIYFQSESVADFKEKLMDLLQSRTNIDKHVKRGYEIAKQYSWDKTTEEYLSVFEQEYNNNN
jgi:alpha-1,3-rhamnosyl/mannosyltransferase